MTPPRLVFWETTAACNLRCAHCRRLDVLEKADPLELSPSEGLALVDDLARIGAGTLVLSGGEPLVRHDVLDLARRGVERGLRVCVATNGTMVDRDVALRLLRAGVLRVSVSLDGGTKATHEALRGAGTWDRTLEALDHLKAVGIETQVNATITRANRPEMDDLYRLAIDRGVAALHLFFLVPVGCGASLDESVALSAGEAEEVLEWLADRLVEGKVFVRATCAPHWQRIVRRRGLARAAGHPRPGAAGRHAFAAFTRGCLAGTGIVFISHRGDVFPCGYLPLAAGNVRKRPFAEIWADSPAWRYFREGLMLEGRCGVCEFRNVCMGCRARAAFAHGSLLGEDPACAYVPARMRGEGGPA